jgi:hypothetical protein
LIKESRFSGRMLAGFGRKGRGFLASKAAQVTEGWTGELVHILACGSLVILSAVLMFLFYHQLCLT